MGRTSRNCRPWEEMWVFLLLYGRLAGVHQKKKEKGPRKIVRRGCYFQDVGAQAPFEQSSDHVDFSCFPTTKDARRVSVNSRLPWYYSDCGLMTPRAFWLMTQGPKAKPAKCHWKTRNNQKRIVSGFKCIQRWVYYTRLYIIRYSDQNALSTASIWKGAHPKHKPIAFGISLNV